MTHARVSAALGLLGSGWACWIQLNGLYAYDYLSICDISTRLACVDPLLGRAGFMFGISLPQVSLFLSAALVTLSLAGENLQSGRTAAGVGVLGVTVSTRLIALPLVDESAFCLACLATGLPLLVASVLTLVRPAVQAMAGSRPTKRDRLTTFQSGRTPIALFLVLATVGMLVSIQQFPNPAEISYDADAEVVPSSGPSDELEFPILTARVFVDYQRCQTCSAVVNDVEAMARLITLERGIPINVEIADFPLDSACNLTAKVATESRGCLAAGAVRFMVPLGLASELRTWLFSSGGNWTVDDLLERVHGASRRADFRVSYDTTLREKLAADVSAAVERGIRTVPTIELSGKLLSGSHSITSVRRFLEGGLISTASALDHK